MCGDYPGGEGVSKLPVDHHGNYVITALFKEKVNHADPAHIPVFTLRREDLVTKKYGTLPSLWRLYIEAMDPAEHNFVSKHLGSWDLWLQL